ncbi:MAG: hypothetical protein UU08_C0010G0010 [Candidatus Uhrbacteria bacterium GW2011_GWE2_40_58]|nr:MAG: hypothetical protein UT94_C0012G0007 [Candidatus Uhrbacteria bacterium GW2011_GWF2_40_263]KKR67715.1 MAG: hypothetical protein UU08_C0010G0010 [Candidatus Uhrbacteria bacterium GW2011_GWE2_40_58]OGL93502.1 MAG: hypothetical protein A2239_02735 [Candidatus Uhrbacteria bacterium RIFOXYA2_FULL_40_9]OGL96635.1 MAG: hypothetical protein A2332_02695 [Candidatus Uhrbacteria bacterium RIFOXYB2_FULL_41_18]HBK35265.1 hypothetical protein [Candidatus Uhrbacteria bacterium]
MIVVQRFDLDSGIKRNHELFEKAREEEKQARHYQRMKETEKRFCPGQSMIWWIALIATILLDIIFLSLFVYSIATKQYWYCPWPFFVFFFLLFLLGMEYMTHRSNKKQDEQLAKLLSEESVQARQAIFDNEAYRLAWMLMLRSMVFNRTLDELTQTQKEQWNDWARLRLTERYHEILCEVKACPFLRAPIRNRELTPAIDRLRHYLLLSPDEFEQLVGRL